MPPKIILKPGAKPFEFFDADGMSRSLPIFVNTETNKETVQCNRCGIHINSAHLAPLHCPLCPLGPTGQPPTFWKYCFTQHMVMHHRDTDENLESPPIPFDLMKKVHISLGEGMAMGGSSESMMKYRENYGIPNSDAFEADSEPLNRWDAMQLRLGRKRTGSEVSKTSSSERDASPTKIQRM
jgi:hypothetical protein